VDLPIADGRTDYVRIAEAIAYLRAHQRRQPDLAAHLEHSPVETAALLGRIFHSKEAGGEKSLSVWVSGSNFQIQVWRALLQIPFARLLNYQQLAAFLGRPKAARAVGNAIAHNPVAYLIPCHRVLRQSGDFGKYHWGAERKAALVVWEAASDAETVR